MIGVVGIGAKLYMDLSGSIQKTYESVERENQEEGKRENPLNFWMRFILSAVGQNRYLDERIKDVQMRSWWQQLIQQMDRQTIAVPPERM